MIIQKKCRITNQYGMLTTGQPCQDHVPRRYSLYEYHIKHTSNEMMFISASGYVFASKFFHLLFPDINKKKTQIILFLTMINNNSSNNNKNG